MAKIELRHLDCTQRKRYATVEIVELYSKDAIQINTHDLETNEVISIILDKSTSIRFAKTLRTEINRLKR